jgi:ABC-type nitrate/sulfonate/bicarbonate transport system substrate-binding protein
VPPPKPTEAPKPAATTAPAAPAKPAAAPTTAPAAKPAEAKPAASPAAQPAASPAAKPAPSTGSGQALSKAEGPAEAKPAAAASPAAKPAAKPETIVVPKPTGETTFKIAHASVVGFADLPMVLTTERINPQGWKIENTFFAQSELAVESVAKGDTPIGSGASNAFLLAIQKGAPMQLVAERSSNEWLIVAKNQFKTCADLNGKRLAIHSEGGVSTAMVRAWIATCNGTPNYLIVPGSENRAAALVNDQIDASPIELADWININRNNPGRFIVVQDLAKGLPDLLVTPIVVNTSWAERNKAVMSAYLAELVKTNRMVAANPQLLEDASKKHIPSLDAKNLPEIIKAFQEINGFDPNGALTLKRVEGTLKVFTDGKILEPGLVADKVANTSYLEEALRIVGKL